MQYCFGLLLWLMGYEKHGVGREGIALFLNDDTTCRSWWIGSFSYE